MDAESIRVHHSQWRGGEGRGGVRGSMGTRFLSRACGGGRGGARATETVRMGVLGPSPNLDRWILHIYPDISHYDGEICKLSIYVRL